MQLDKGGDEIAWDSFRSLAPTPVLSIPFVPVPGREATDTIF